MAPEVCFVMAVYNGGELLRETIASVLAQTYRDFELVIADDGSTDGTVAHIRSLTDPRVRLIENGRLASQSKCLMRAIEAVDACWIARIDADDPAHPNRLELMLPYLREANGYGMVASEVDFLHGNVPYQWEPASARRPEIQDVTSRLALYNPIAHSSSFIRREAFLAVGGYAPRHELLNDYWLWAKLAHAGWKLGQVPLRLQAKRIHSGQAFEGRHRLRYLLGSIAAQIWFGRHVCHTPGWKLYPTAVARLGFGLLGVGLRARLRGQAVTGRICDRVES